LSLGFLPGRWWWEFNGSDAALRLLGTDADAALFDPQSNNNDFTIAGRFMPDSDSGDESIMCKWDVSPNKCWMVRRQNQDLHLLVSDDGSNTTQLALTSALNADEDIVFCGRYEYDSAGAVNDMWLDATGQSEVSTAVARGPVNSTTSADVQIADCDAGTGKLTGREYWLAFYNRKLTDAEKDGLLDGTIKPQQLLEPGDFYIDFHAEVGATLDSDFPVVSPVEFTVEGTPVQGGVSWYTGPHRMHFKPSERHRWRFDGSGDALRLAGSSAGLFDPQSNANDFTVAGVISPSVASGDKGVFCKRNQSNASWWLYMNSGYLRLRVSQSGSPGSYSDVWANISTGNRRFVGRYKYSGSPGTSSDLWLDTESWYGQFERTRDYNGSAYGPIYSSSGIDVQIGDFDDSADRWFNGLFYWLAYWNRKLTDVETEMLVNGSVEPRDLNPDYYEEFNDTPDGTQSSEIPDSPSLDFTVEGNPTLEDLGTWPDPKPTVTSMDEYLDDLIAVSDHRRGEPPLADPDDDYWHIEEASGTDGDGLALTDADGGDEFAQSSVPFSWCALIRFPNGVNGYRHLCCKWDNTGPAYCFDCQIVGVNGAFRPIIWTPTENGFYITNMFPAWNTPNDSVYLCCHTWEPNVSRGYVCRPSGEGATGTGSIASGAPQATTAALGIGASVVGGGIDIGDIFWWAWWNGTPVKDQAFFEALYNKEIDPVDTNPKAYVDFHKRVVIGGKYLSEIGNFNFDVLNTPVHYGAGNPTVGPISKGIEWPALHAHAATYVPIDRPRPTAQYKGLVRHQPGDTERKDGGAILMPGDAGYLATLHGAGVFNPIDRPRSTAQHKGLVAIARYKRKKA